MSILRLATLWPLVTSEDFSYKLALASTFVTLGLTQPWRRLRTRTVIHEDLALASVLSAPTGNSPSFIEHGNEPRMSDNLREIHGGRRS
ncbi:hypothetical protein N7454_001908 [Penicillium verhagenii]|nr:hypothetical protein N7454_001908 [Penicillium verhagenii]